MNPIKISNSALKNEPNLKWNSFIEFLVNSEYDEINSIQKVAWLCFFYDTEVLNGGHLQYFTNRKGEYYFETLNALKMIGAYKQKEILQSFLELFDKLDLGDIESRDEYIEKVLVGYDYEFKNEQSESIFENHIKKCDIEYEWEPTTLNLLKEYFEKN